MDEQLQSGETLEELQEMLERLLDTSSESQLAADHANELGCLSCS